MPHVMLRVDHYKAGADVRVLVEKVKAVIRESASEELSILKFRLGPEDFSFHVFRLGPDDEMIKDVEVIIFAHEFPARREQIDPISDAIGTAVDEAVLEFNSDLTSNTFVMLGCVGYFPGRPALPSAHHQGIARLVHPDESGRLLA